MLLQQQVGELQADNWKQKLKISEQDRCIQEQAVRIDELLERRGQASGAMSAADDGLSTDVAPVNSASGTRDTTSTRSTFNATSNRASFVRAGSSYGAKAQENPADRGKRPLIRMFSNAAVKVADWIDWIDVVLDLTADTVQTVLVRALGSSGAKHCVPASLRSSMTEAIEGLRKEVEPPEEVTLEESMWGVVLLIGTDAMGDAT